MIRIAVLEDEQPYYLSLKGFIDRCAEEQGQPCQVVWFSDGATLLAQYRDAFDVLLLDVELPGLDGITVAREVRRVDQSVLIIFITNMAQYAIKGYEVDALDYVIKPVSYPAFALKFQKALRILRERVGKSVLLTFSDEQRFVPQKDILYVEVASHTIQYHTYAGTSSASGSLGAVEKQLDERLFARCNSCYLVNLAHVTGLRGDYVLVEGEPLKMSRPKKKLFVARLAAWYNGGGR